MRLVRRYSPDALAALFGASSLVHLIRPQVFEPLIPTWLPNARVVVYLSGIAELACAFGLAKRTNWARPASVVLLVVVFPGNVQMLVNAVHDSDRQFSASVLVAVLRLPLQLPLIWAALQARAERGSTRRLSDAVIAPDGQHRTR